MMNYATDTKIAWLAGIMDAAGSISVRKKPKYTNWYDLQIRVSAVSPTQILEVKRILHAMGISFTEHVNNKSKTATRPYLTIQVARAKDTEELLKKLLPYLINKKPEAEEVIQWLQDGKTDCAVVERLQHMKLVA
jgi:hypothetical protein